MISIFVEQVTNRNRVTKGSKVSIRTKQGMDKEGEVETILTNKRNHPRGIKVRLKNGDVGRINHLM